MPCTQCGTTLAPDVRCCPHCGAASAALPPRSCPTCRTALPVGAAFCPACGAEARSGSAAPFLPPGPAAPALPPTTPALPNGGAWWGKVALGGLGGLLAGQMLGGGGGLFGGRGWGERDDRGDRGDEDGDGGGGFDGEG